MYDHIAGVELYLGCSEATQVSHAKHDWSLCCLILISAIRHNYSGTRNMLLYNNYMIKEITALIILPGLYFVWGPGSHKGQREMVEPSPQEGCDHRCLQSLSCELLT